MKRIKKTVSVILAASMLMSLGACQDKSMDEVLDLAEDVAKYTCDLDYKKLSKLTEDGDEELEEIFEGIGDDGFREIIASTLEYEFDEDSLEKDGKKGYTVDVTFTYVDYEEVLGDEDIYSYEDFEDAVDDCDEVVEETITLEFEKDGSDILFTNISDLEDLFPYWDEEFTLGVTGGVEEADAEEDEDTEADPTPAPTATPTPTPAPTATPTPAPATGWDDPDYPNPADYAVDGQAYLLPHSNILFTCPEGSSVDTEYSSLGIDGSNMYMFGGDDDDYNSSFYISSGTPISCYDELIFEMRDDSVESSAEYTWHYESHEVSYINMDVDGCVFEGALATVHTTDGETTYVYVVYIGNEDRYFHVVLESNDMNYIYSCMDGFTLVG